MESFDTDYLIIGAGAAGLAFADTLIAEAPDAHVTIVDRRGKPGGHWNDAYSFVTLHQPSAFYGVNSLALGSGRIDEFGPNRGLHELASGAEVCSYFEQVMKHRLLPSGRVRYLPMSRHLGDGTIESLLSGARTQVSVRRKFVDGTYFSPSVPSTHPPAYTIADGVRLVPPNALPGLWQHADEAGGLPRSFVVLGAGKTAMDVCTWLLQSGAAAEAIRWVMPRDSWVVNRVTTQNSAEFFHPTIGGQAAQLEAFASATSVDDLFLRLEALGLMRRIDPSVTPTMFHFATLAEGEVELLRGIRDVVRLGRVQALEPDAIVLAQGRVPVEPGTLFIDCTASAVEPRAPQPAFQPGRIVVQMVRAPQPAFSAALIAYVEVHGRDDADKNRLCASVPFPNTPADYPRTMLANMMNQYQWGQDKVLRDWIRASRLDGFSRLISGADRDDPAQQAVLARMKEAAMPAAGNLQKLIAQQRA